MVIGTGGTNAYIENASIIGANAGSLRFNAANAYGSPGENWNGGDLYFTVGVGYGGGSLGKIRFLASTTYFGFGTTSNLLFAGTPLQGGDAPSFTMKGIDATQSGWPPSGNYRGGDFYVSPGLGCGSGSNGEVFIGDIEHGGLLHAKSAETNIIYYDEATGKLSYGAAGSGGSGEASSLKTTNFTITEESGKLVIKYGTTIIASMSSTGLITTADDVETFGTP